VWGGTLSGRAVYFFGGGTEGGVIRGVAGGMKRIVSGFFEESLGRACLSGGPKKAKPTCGRGFRGGDG